MKKKIFKVTGLLIILSIILLFSIRQIKASSISDNTSNGITLRSNSRAKQIDCKSATEFDLPASNPAVLDEYGIGSVCEFTDATQDVVLAEYRVPLGIDTSVQPYIQMHWSCPTADPTGDVVNVRWRLRYKWISSDVSTDLTDSTYEATTDTTVNVNTYGKGLVETNIQLANMTSADDRLHLQITRVGDATQDTDTRADANLFDECLYFIINKLGEAL